MKRFMTVPFVFLFIASCATFNVTYDFDPEADFSRYKTYAWSLPSDKNAISELTAKRIRIAVDRVLKQKGFTLSLENPDMLVIPSGGKERRVDVQEWGYGHDDRTYGGGAWYPGRVPIDVDGRDYYEYRRGVDTFEYEIGTLVLDVVDAKKNELIWRGTASGIIEPGKTAEQVDDVMSRLLSHFPPPKK